MANGTYGIKMPARITAADVDIFYYYRPTRNSESAGFQSFKSLDSSLLLPSEAYYSDAEGTMDLPGMYDLRLPMDIFGSVGFYTVYIKPKEVFTEIADVSTLAAYTDIRGIILETTKLGTQGLNCSNGELVGYRVEYFNGDERLSDYRIITSNNKCEPVAQNLSDSTQKGIRYRFNDSSNLTFCTLTPSSALSFKSNSLPNIGQTGQQIALVNTKFNPVMLEIEMTDKDISSIATMLEGAQIRNLDKGLITTFNEDGGIYHQATYGNITNPNTGINHDFKLPKTSEIYYSEEDRLQEIKDNI